MTLPLNAIELASLSCEQRACLRNSSLQTVTCWLIKMGDVSTGSAMLATGNNLAGKRAR